MWMVQFSFLLFLGDSVWDACKVPFASYGTVGLSLVRLWPVKILTMVGIEIMEALCQDLNYLFIVLVQMANVFCIS